MTTLTRHVVALFAASSLAFGTAILGAPSAQAETDCDTSLTVADYAGSWHWEISSEHGASGQDWTLVKVSDDAGAVLVDAGSSGEGGGGGYKGGGRYTVSEGGVLQDFSTVGQTYARSQMVVNDKVNNVACVDGKPASITVIDSLEGRSITLTRR